MTGKQLKAKRNKAKLSIAQAAQQLGISSRSLCRWEASDDPIPETAARLFVLLNDKKKSAAAK